MWALPAAAFRQVLIVADVTRRAIKGWGSGSVAEHLPGILKA